VGLRTVVDVGNISAVVYLPVGLMVRRVELLNYHSPSKAKHPKSSRRKRTPDITMPAFPDSRLGWDGCGVMETAQDVP